MEMNVIKCDECGRKEDLPAGRRTPETWLRLEAVRLLYRPKEFSGAIQEKNIVDIQTPEKDPDFCSAGCLLAWIGKQVEKITKA
jgi:hypothetical protein